MFKFITDHLKIDEKGQGMVEYGLILALVSVVAIGSLTGVGGKVTGKFNDVVGAIGGPVDGEVDGPVDGESGNVVTVEEVIDSEVIPYGTVEEDAANLPLGETKVKSNGVNGEVKVTYSVTFENGEEVSREEVSREVTKDPVDKVLLVGTKRNEDFEWVSDWYGYSATHEEGDGYYKYVGTDKVVTIPNEINGHTMTSYFQMFDNTDVKKVISNNDKVTDMSMMFQSSPATSLDISELNTSSVTDMHRMFYGLQATSLDVSNFDTSNVTNMSNMFQWSKATSLDLSNFDTSSVTDMRSMFYYSSATSLNLNSFDTSSVTNMNYMFTESNASHLDLSSFDTYKVTDMDDMFQNSRARSGFARTQADANKYNNTSNKPSGLSFTIG